MKYEYKQIVGEFELDRRAEYVAVYTPHNIIPSLQWIDDSISDVSHIGYLALIADECEEHVNKYDLDIFCTEVPDVELSIYKIIKNNYDSDGSVGYDSDA